MVGFLDGSDKCPRPRLIAFSGLPGVGKTTVSRDVAQRICAVWLRIDSIEQAIRASTLVPSDVQDAGYLTAYAIARDNLRLGSDVVTDCVNDCMTTRNAWREVARGCGADLLEIEIVCSDRLEHRRRVEMRIPDIEGHVVPQWDAVIGREYEPWDRAHLIINTAGRDLRSCVEHVLASL